MIPERMRSLIVTGRVYDLGMEYFVGMPHFPTHPPFLFSLGRLHGDMPYEGGVATSNCVFTTGGHTGTHIDAHGHVSLNGKVFGVGDITPHQSAKGLSKGGIDQMAPVVSRGVLLDIAGLEGAQVLDAEYKVGVEALERAVQRQGVAVERGDTLLFRTGWIQYFHDASKYVSHHEGCPGLSEDGAEWLADRDVAFVGSDTSALEKTPTRTLSVHGILLCRHGIHIMEMLNLEDLAIDSVYEFLFVACPLKIRGGTGSPIRPIAVG